MIFGKRDHLGRTKKRAAADRMDEADAQIRQAAGDELMRRQRWTVAQVVAWIATRSKDAIAWRASPTGVAVWRSFHAGGQTALRWEDAWLELAEMMAKGHLSAFASELMRDRVDGSQLERPGVCFPPIDQPGLALSCILVLNETRHVVRPGRHLFVARWTEYVDVSFQRADVVRLFPPTKYSDDNAESAQRLTAKAVADCHRWLSDMMKASPATRPRTKDTIALEAYAQFAVSRRSFDVAWKNAIGDTGANWNAAGAPKKLR